MLRRVIVTALFAMICSTGAAASPWAPVDLVNPGFEQWRDGAPVGWELFPSIDPQGCIVTGAVTDTTDAVEGSRALLLRGDRRTCRWLGPLQAVPVKPGEIYRLQASIRSLGVDPSGQRYRNSQVLALVFDGKDNRLGYFSPGPVTGTTDWTNQAVSIAVPPGAKTLKVGAFLSVPGALLVDDLRLERLTTPTLAADAPRQERWQVATDHLLHLLEAFHPAPFAELPRDRFVAELAALPALTAELDDKALTWRLRELVCGLGDSHTATGLPAGANARLPLSLRFFGDEVRVVAAPPALADLVGGRLTAVDGRPLAEVLAGISPQIARTHENWFREQAPGWLLFPGALHAFGVADAPHAVRYTVAHDDGTGATLRAALDTPADGDWIVAGPPEGERPLYRRRGGGAYWFEYLPTERTLYLKYDQAREDPARPLQKFGQELLKVLDREKIDRFVLDVRHNAGGRNQFDSLFRELATRAADGRIGQNFVITGRRTYSAAVYDADAMRQRCGAVVVGEPTGMAPVHPGQVAEFTLPGLGLDFYCSTKMIRASSDTSPALIPDVPAEVAWEDFLAGRDPLLEAVLGYKGE